MIGRLTSASRSAVATALRSLSSFSPSSIAAGCGSSSAPRAESTIGNTDDWLRMVFIHEYTHIAHLSRAGGWKVSLFPVDNRAY